MHRRQPLPRLWMMTDERQAAHLWRALERLPEGSGVVFRHQSLGRPERRALFERVKRLCRRRRLMLLLAGDARLSRAWGADGIHGRGDRRPGPSLVRSASAHNLRELKAAERAGADLVFVSPVFPTRSHPDGRTLGRTGFCRIARQSRLPVIALGGMDHQSGRTLVPRHAYGWAAIDAWTV